jgi:hypothetical protein
MVRVIRALAIFAGAAAALATGAYVLAVNRHLATLPDFSMWRHLRWDFGAYPWFWSGLAATAALEVGFLVWFLKWRRR